MSVAIAKAIHTVREVTGLDEGEVRTVGATLFIDTVVGERERDCLDLELDPRRIDVMHDEAKTRIDL